MERHAMRKHLLLLDPNIFRGVRLKARLGTSARCDWARTPEAAFERIRESFGAGDGYHAVVLPAGQARFMPGIESLYRTFSPAGDAGPRIVVMTGADGEGEPYASQSGARVVVAPDLAEATRAALSS
jgi:hypothetical protein